MKTPSSPSTNLFFDLDMSLKFISHPHELSSSVTGAIVFLHGLGATAHDFADLPKLLSLPETVRYFFPQAPNIPVTINGGMTMPAWYDIKDMRLERETDLETISKSIHLLNEFLNEIISHDIPPERIVLGGFSQGGAMAMEMGFLYPKRFAGIISLSAYTLSPKKLKQGDYDHRMDVPFLLCHGHQDQVVPYELGDRHRKMLQEQGFDLEWYEEEGLGHCLSQGEVDVMRDWLKRLPSFIHPGDE